MTSVCLSPKGATSCRTDGQDPPHNSRPHCPVSPSKPRHVCSSLGRSRTEGSRSVPGLRPPPLLLPGAEREWPRPLGSREAGCRAERSHRAGSLNRGCQGALCSAPRPSLCHLRSILPSVCLGQDPCAREPEGQGDGVTGCRGGLSLQSKLQRCSLSSWGCSDWRHMGPPARLLPPCPP